MNQTESIVAEDRYRLLVESTDAVPWEYSIVQDRWTYVAPQVRRILGYDPEQWTDVRFWAERIHPDDREWATEYCSLATKRGEAHVFEYRFRAADGNYVWIRDLVNVEMDDSTPVGLRGFMLDITERKNDEQRIRNLLSEKDTLLRELRHRVKNSFATLSALLDLQACRTENTETVTALQDAHRRVAALQIVYDQLNHNPAEAKIAVDEYLKTLSERIMSVTALNDRIQLKTDVDPLRISSDLVLPLGIIANELLTNCLKYAFPSARCGTIVVSLKAVAGREAALTVRDNGIGYDAARADTATGLGHTLTNTLAQQIHGVVSIESTADGTTVTVKFPLPAANHADA